MNKIKNKVGRPKSTRPLIKGMFDLHKDTVKPFDLIIEERKIKDPQFCRAKALREAVECYLKFYGKKLDSNFDEAEVKRILLKYKTKKLNAGIVREIRELSTDMPRKEICKDYGITPSMLSNILLGRTWKNA